MRNIPHNREKEELYMKKRLLSLALALPGQSLPSLWSG